jgi:hypothetical protein
MADLAADICLRRPHPPARLLAEVVSLIGPQGIVSGQARILCADGGLMATGTSNMVAVPLPALEEENQPYRFAILGV